MGTEYSNIKILHHTDRIEKLMKDEACAPIYVRIKPTNRCNQNCYYCFYASNNNVNVYETRHVNRNHEISWTKMQEIISDLSVMGVRAITFSGGGDPLVYPYICDTASLVQSKSIDYALITNGQELHGEKANVFANAKWVRISIESADADTYKRIRGVDTYYAVRNNIENFAKCKSKNCTLGVNCVINDYNADTIYEFCKVMKEIGVENIKFSPVNVGLDIVEKNKDIKEKVDEQLMKAIQDLSDDSFNIINKYSDDIKERIDYTKLYTRCYVQNLFTIIAADSCVYRCIDKAYIPGGMLGSIKDQSFREMWYSESTRQKLKNYDVCKECNFRCIYEDRNKLLNELFSLDSNHINFI